MPHKTKRGGKRRGAGRTATGTAPPINFKVTPAQHAELAAEAARDGLPSASLAAKRRAFPATKETT